MSGERRTIKRVRDALARTDARVEVNLVFECPVAWESMAQIRGADDVRHCSECDKQVYDLTNTPKSEVLTLIRRSGGDLCGQVARRSDGRIVFGRCGHYHDPNIHLVRGGLGS